MIQTVSVSLNIEYLDIQTSDQDLPFDLAARRLGKCCYVARLSKQIGPKLAVVG